MKNHIQLPACILRGFAKRRRIKFENKINSTLSCYVLNVKTLEISCESVKKIGIKDNYYDEKLEKLLDRGFENKLSLTIQYVNSTDIENIDLKSHYKNIKNFIKINFTRDPIIHQLCLDYIKEDHMENKIPADIVPTMSVVIAATGKVVKREFDNLHCALIINNTDIDFVSLSGTVYKITAGRLKGYLMPISPKKAFALIEQPFENDICTINCRFIINVFNLLAFLYEQDNPNGFIVAKEESSLLELKNAIKDNSSLNI